MPFAAFDLFARVIPDCFILGCGLDRLTINPARPRHRSPPALATLPLGQPIQHRGPDPLQAPATKGIIPRFPRPKTTRQQSPRTPRLVQIQKAIDDLARSRGGRPGPPGRQRGTGSNGSIRCLCPSVRSVAYCIPAILIIQAFLFRVCGET